MLWGGLLVELIILIILQKKLYGCNLRKLKHLRTAMKEGEAHISERTIKEN